MLKIHKGLKKKKKDKKHKRKGEDDLFDEEELERYRKEHQQQQHQGDEQGSSRNGDATNKAPSSANSDEWQKFKALTAGIDCVLQKTQEDLDRIKSTSFFQRKPVPSEVSKVENDSHILETEVSSHKQRPKKGYPDDTGHADSGDKGDLHCERDFEETNEELAVEEEAEEEEEIEEEEDIFNTSYVDAVASGELKLAYIPDSPTEEQQEGDDPFDTSIADKFIVNNPKKRYLNLGCAVQVLSGKVESTCTSPAVVASSTAKRRIVRPVQLLLDSFDEGVPITSEPIVPLPDSPIKTLLDEDTTDFGDKTPGCEVLPLPAVVPTTTLVSEPVPPIPKTGCQSPGSVPLIESLSLAEFENLSLTAPPETIPFKQNSIDSCGSIDDEFAELAQARKSVVVVTTPIAPLAVTPTDLAISPIGEFHHEIGADPFDTSIADKVIGDSQLEEESHLLGHQSVSVLAGIEDDDFDPRAEDNILTSPSHIPTTVSPTLSPTLTITPITDIPFTTINSPTQNSIGNYEEGEDESADNYDPFDTSHITSLNSA